MRGPVEMDESCIYQFRIKGQLADRWSEWFEGFTICRDSPDETALTGPVVDQAALFGFLNKIHALNLVLISVNRLTNQPPGGDR